MNKAEKTIGLVIIGFAIAFGLVYILLSLTGESIITSQIEQLTHKKTTIGHFNLSPALNLEIKDLKVEGLAKIKSISITTNLPSLFTGRTVFNSLKIVSPEFTFVKAPAPASIVGEVKASTDVISPAPAGQVVVAVKPRAIRLMPLGFRRIRIENGVVNFLDQSISADGIKIVLKDISCKISNLYFYPRPIATSFELKGKIPWREGQDVGQLNIDGWVNLFKKDMQATLKIKDIDAVYLHPYYSNWVNLEKARIEKAKLNFTTDIIGLNNNVSAECHLELTDMVRKPLEPGQGEEKASKITDKVLDMFKTVDQGKVELNFTLKTKMDSPQFGFGAFKMAFEEKISKGLGLLSPKPENILALPFKIMENGVKSFADLTRAMIDGVFAIGREIGHAGKGSTQK
ncbi:MAG: DUF748 domain-containing protein [Candidatus Omnitrophota bacterium]|nr:DUF748 domain-containing protein [Candidatus Omnitrophota bacterium]